MNIVTIDVRGVSNITDYFIIAEGNVDRHVQTLADAVEEIMGYKPFRAQGREYGDWIVLDYLDVLVHLFTPEMREKYQLEQVWKAGKIVSVSIDYGKVLKT